MRCGSCTHAFNSDQRYVSLKFDYKGGDELRVTAAPNGNITPPGVYFLYTINRAGLPFDGITVFMSSDPQTQAEQEWETISTKDEANAHAEQATPFASNQTECEHVVDAMTPLTRGVAQNAARHERTHS